MHINCGDTRDQKSNNTRKEHVTALPDWARIVKRETGNWQVCNGGYFTWCYFYNRRNNVGIWRYHWKMCCLKINPKFSHKIVCAHHVPCNKFKWYAYVASFALWICVHRPVVKEYIVRSLNGHVHTRFTEHANLCLARANFQCWKQEIVFMWHIWQSTIIFMTAAKWVVASRLYTEYFVTLRHAKNFSLT